ncbi:hypothetical protein C6495_14030 [Candidatus Poribacteria bacterium]|nr:MAG: hypothetical protein C6495_14030 [Candidatus Poribacteria bacterium]
MLRPAEPGQIYEDLVSNGFASARFHFCRSSFNHGLRWRVFFALTTLLTLIIYGNIKNVNFFCEKFAKNVETGSILANFSFFVKFFARKMRKMSNSREKLTKTSKLV